MSTADDAPQRRQGVSNVTVFHAGALENPNSSLGLGFDGVSDTKQRGIVHPDYG